MFDQLIETEAEEKEFNLSEEQISHMAQKGRESLFFFIRAILNFNKLCPRIHLSLCKTLEDPDKKRVEIIIPRDWYKTTIATISYPIWRAISNPDIRTLLVQNTYSNACKKLGAIRSIFEKNMLFRACYPEILPTSKEIWKSEALCVNRDSHHPEATFEAAGTGTQVTGRHYDLIIEDDTIAPRVDDMTGVLMQPTQAEIEKAIGWHRLVHPLLVEPAESQILVIGTRWVEGDLLQWIMENESSYEIVTRAVKEDDLGRPDENGHVVWPERFDEGVLKQLRQALDVYMYSALYMNTPVATANQIFRREWIHYYDTIPKGCISATAVDPAPSDADSTSDPDYNVVLSASINPKTGDIYVQHYNRERLNPGDLVNRIFDHNRAFSPIVTRVEANAYQRTLAYWIIERQRMDNEYFFVEPVTTLRNKDDRIRGLQPLFAAGKIFLRADMGVLETELLSFPRGRHDDVIDCLSMLLDVFKNIFSNEREYQRKYEHLDIVGQLVDELRIRNGKNKGYPFDLGLSRFTGDLPVRGDVFKHKYDRTMSGAKK